MGYVMNIIILTEHENDIHDLLLIPGLPLPLPHPFYLLAAHLTWATYSFLQVCGGAILKVQAFPKNLSQIKMAM